MEFKTSEKRLLKYKTAHMKNITIAIADDFKIFREGLKVILATHHNYEVLFEAENGQDLMEKLKKVQPMVIIMDLKMPVLDGLEATKLIRQQYPAVKILVVTMYDDDKFVLHLMELGANGYLLKNAEPDEIKKAIEAVSANGYYFNDLVNKALLKKLFLKDAFDPVFNDQVRLSNQEIQILQWICEEKSAQEIGQELYLTSRAVDDIKQNLIKKIGVRNTAGLVMFAIKQGIVK